MLPKEVEDYLDLITGNIDFALRHITSYGKGKTLKTNRPKHGTYAYIWRMCRFHSGQNVSMPITAFWYLSNQIQDDTGHKYLFSIIDETQREILDRLDAFVDEILDHMNSSKYEAALAYDGLLY